MATINSSRVILITGANNGIGLALTRTLLEMEKLLAMMTERAKNVGAASRI